MKVKVYCPCGAKFEFEVEPVHGRMPVSIGCPVCGADATALANDVIQQQLAPPENSDTPAEVPAVSRAGLRIAKAAPAAEGAPETSRPAPRAVSPARTTTANPGWKKHLDEPKMHPLVKTAVLAVVAVVALAGAAWFWYVWFARDPKVVYSLDFPQGDLNSSGKPTYRSDGFYELIAPDRLLSIKSQHVTLRDVAQGSSIWSVPVAGGIEDSYSNPRVIATTNDIWLAWSDQLVRLDRQTGAQKPLSISDPVIDVESGDNMILVLSGSPSAGEAVTQFSLPDGTAQTEVVNAPPQTNNAARPVATTGAGARPDETTDDEPTPRNPVQAAVGERVRNLSFQAAGNAPRDKFVFDRLSEGTQPLYDAVANAVWVQTRLLEHREVAHQAMKPQGRSVLDSPNLNASQGIDLAEEMANNSQRERTGGVDIEDVSRYQVTLHRLFAQNVPDWTGEIVGPPVFVPLKTVDLIVAGTNLFAFDKSNKKLWDARLTFPVSAEYGSRPPCLETGGALYFADKGMLTRFDPATGNVRWRLPSVGISAVQADDRGKLYFDTTTLRPETIQYSQQINLREKDQRVIMQVDPATGSIVWHSDFPGSSFNCLVSGKFLYSTRVWQTQDPLRLEEGPDTHFTMKLLQPADGKMIWNLVRNDRQLIKAEVRQNWILLQYEDQVSVLKFFSL